MISRRFHLPLLPEVPDSDGQERNNPVAIGIFDNDSSRFQTESNSYFRILWKKRLKVRTSLNLLEPPMQEKTSHLDLVVCCWDRNCQWSELKDEERCNKSVTARQPYTAVSTQCGGMSGRAIWTAAGPSCAECPSQVALENRKSWKDVNLELQIWYSWIRWIQIRIRLNTIFRSSLCLPMDSFQVFSDLQPDSRSTSLLTFVSICFCKCLTCVGLGLLRCRTCARPILCADDPEATLLKAHSCTNCITGFQVSQWPAKKRAVKLENATGNPVAVRSSKISKSEKTLPTLALYSTL